jgi:branched-chain amino acid transport system ATP-binding protein
MLEVRAIDVHYGPIQALRGVSLRVEDGEMVALVGANGAGKSTTLRTVSGLLQPTAGEILWNGTPIQGWAAPRVTSSGIAHLPEGRDLFGALSVAENLKLGHWTRRSDKKGFRRRLELVMDHFPILRERASQPAGTLSGGEQQMLGIARALMSSPALLIVDELSLGLAPMIVAQLFDILGEVNSEGAAILLVEQFVHLALGHTRRAYVLAKGEIVLEGSSADLLADPHLIASYLGEEEPAARPGAARPSPSNPPPKRRSRAGAGAG